MALMQIFHFIQLLQRGSLQKLIKFRLNPCNSVLIEHINLFKLTLGQFE